MSRDVDESIDFCYRLLGLLWMVGAISLGTAWLEGAGEEDCALVICHIEKI